jgi:hypothetical protein
MATYQVKDEKNLWHSRTAAMVAAIVLDGCAEGDLPPAAADLARLARENGGRPELVRATWRVLDHADPRAFAEATGHFLGGADWGEPAAIYMTRHPGHEPALRELLQGGTGKARPVLAGYALIGLLRTGTPSAIDAAVEALKAEGESADRVKRALGGHVADVDERVDADVLPGLLAVTSALGEKTPDAVRAGVARIYGSLNGLGVTPARRARLRADLRRLLESNPGRDAATEAIAGLGLLASPDDVAFLERLAEDPKLEGNAVAAIGAIRAFNPDTGR